MIRLKGYSSVAGLTVTGDIVLRMTPYGDPVVPLSSQFGLLTIGGSGAAHGRIKLSENRLTGTLTRRAVARELLAGPRSHPAATPLLNPPPPWEASDRSL